MPLARSVVFPLLLAASAFAAESGGLPKQSPFVPVGGPASVAAANETLEFAGVSSVGKKTDLIFHDKAAKKTHWIAEGETKEGITVVRYDARRDVAVVKVQGVEKTLPLRKSAGPVNAPAGVAPMPTGFNIPPAPPVAAAPALMPAPVAPAPAPAVDPAAAPIAPAASTPATPEVQKRQETEARMLVSDLLEIGMAQRKAYEEAQRKAAEGNNAPATTPAAAPAAQPATGTTPTAPEQKPQSGN